MIKRTLAQELKSATKLYPVVAVLGPRQSGKTTLVKAVFKKYIYISLEELNNQKLALTGPRHFLEKNKNN